METLISKADISRLARPCYTDDQTATACIKEAELQDIRPHLGDALYSAMKKNADTARMEILLAGGEYDDADGRHRIFGGVKSALAYYSLARIVKTANSVPTRFGMVDKNDSYSSHSDIKERIAVSGEYYESADAVMRDTLRYLNDHADTYTEFDTKTKLTNRRISIKMIGK
jgi:hypothetical protein